MAIISTVGIILVIYKQAQNLSLLYASLHRQTFKEFRTYFVDNNPDDSDKNISLELNKQFLLDIKYLQTGYNSGYALGNNLGAEAAMHDGCEYIFFLNNDTELHEDCILELVNTMRSDTSIGVCAPLILYGTKDAAISVIQEFGESADFRSYRTKKYLAGTVWKMEGPELQNISYVDMVSGGASFARTEALKKTGLWEESYFAYGDEIDLAKRFRDTGYRTAAVSRAILWHNHKWDKSNKSGYYFEYYLIQRNKYLYFRKNGFTFQIIVSFTLDLLKFPWRLLWFIKVCDFRLGMYYLKGTLDGLLGKTGKPSFVS